MTSSSNSRSGETKGPELSAAGAGWPSIGGGCSGSAERPCSGPRTPSSRTARSTGTWAPTTSPATTACAPSPSSPSGSVAEGEADPAEVADPCVRGLAAALRHAVRLERRWRGDGADGRGRGARVAGGAARGRRPCADGVAPPAALRARAAHQAEMEVWARRVGWR